MLSIDQLRKGLTFDEAKAAILAVLVTLGFPVTSWQPGGIALAIVTVLAGSAALAADQAPPFAFSPVPRWQLPARRHDR